MTLTIKPFPLMLLLAGVFALLLFSGQQPKPAHRPMRRSASEQAEEIKQETRKVGQEAFYRGHANARK